MVRVVHVEAPDAENALALIEKLPGVHAELVPVGAERCEVQIELGEEDGLDNSGMPSPPGGLHATSQSLLCG